MKVKDNYSKGFPLNLVDFFFLLQLGILNWHIFLKHVIFTYIFKRIMLLFTTIYYIYFTLVDMTYFLLFILK